MIINYPTGLYQLPKDPSDNRSVTFMISNTEPPRTNLLFPKITSGLVNRKRVPKTLSLAERRSNLGDLIFTVSRAYRVIEGNNSKQFETGHILSFDESPTKEADPMLVSKNTETQHDLNKFDYDLLGISAEEQQIIENQSLNTHDILMDRLNNLKRMRADSEVIVNTQQKIINEANRNIEALEIIADSSSETSNEVLDLIVKLQNKRQEALIKRDAAVIEANRSASEADRVISELRTVGTVLK